MGMYDTLTVDDNAPIDDRICERDWQCHEEDTGASFRVNSEGELEAKKISVKDGVDLDENEYPTPDQLENKRSKLTEYNGPFYLSGLNYNAVLMVWNGNVKETKFNKIDFEKIKEEVREEIDI